MAYPDPKTHQGTTYRGMRVGGVHRWSYPDGQWTESKVAPDRWRVTYTSLKRRRAKAPAGSGAEVGSGYHWFIVAHQWADKLDANTYATHLEGDKYLVSFRKPGWKGWSTEMRGRKGARQRTIAILEDALARLRSGEAPGDLERPDSSQLLMDLAKAFQGGLVPAPTPAPAPAPAPPEASQPRSKRGRRTRPGKRPASRQSPPPRAKATEGPTQSF